MAEASRRTSACEDMSAANASTAGLPEVVRMSAAARSARGRSRPVMPTWAPRPARPIAVALPIPPVPPVIRATLPDIGRWSGMVCAIDGDDHRSSGMSVSDMTDCLGDCTQRVCTVDDRCDLARLDEPLEDKQIRSVLKLDGRPQLVA